MAEVAGAAQASVATAATVLGSSRSVTSPSNRSPIWNPVQHSADLAAGRGASQSLGSWSESSGRPTNPNRGSIVAR